MVSINGGIAAAARNGQYKRQGAAATRNGQYKKRGALPQGDLGSKKFMVLPVSIKAWALPQREMGSIKSGGAAARRSGQ